MDILADADSGPERRRSPVDARMTTIHPDDGALLNGPEPSTADADPSTVREARRLAAEVSRTEAPIRLLGGLAVRLRRRPKEEALFSRQFEDIDLISVGLSPRQIADFAKGMNYAGDRQFNALNGARRQIFYGESGLKVEVFVNTFAM